MQLSDVCTSQTFVPSDVCTVQTFVPSDVCTVRTFVPFDVCTRIYNLKVNSKEININCSFPFNKPHDFLRKNKSMNITNLLINLINKSMNIINLLINNLINNCEKRTIFKDFDMIFIIWGKELSSWRKGTEFFKERNWIP